MPPDHADALRLVGELRSRLDALEAVLRGEEEARPPTPTPAWCLLPGGLVRWAGDPVRLRRGLRDLLRALLACGAAPGRPVSYAALEDHLDDCNDSRLAKALSELNAVLAHVGWPREYHASGDGHVITT